MILNDFSIVPMIVGAASPNEVAEVLQKLWGGEETLILISSDLSHYLPYNEAKTRDNLTRKKIEHLAARELKKRCAVLAGEENLEIEIRWPGRNRSVISDIVAGRRYVVVEPTEPDLPPRVMRFGP